MGKGEKKNGWENRRLERRIERIKVVEEGKIEKKEERGEN